jgi:hypothetical protein
LIIVSRLHRGLEAYILGEEKRVESVPVFKLVIAEKKEAYHR